MIKLYKFVSTRCLKLINDLYLFKKDQIKNKIIRKSNYLQRNSYKGRIFISRFFRLIKKRITF